MEDKKKDFIREMEKTIKREFPKFLKRKARAFREKQKVLKNFENLSQQLFNEEKVKEIKQENPPIHPWRPCPAGHCWVKTHPRKVSPSVKNPDGYTMVDGHCRINKSKKEIIYFDEIKRISDQYFRNLKEMPCPIDLEFNSKKKNGMAYDHLIAGWTQYWNEVFKPSEPLEPNLVKALMASESGFNPKVVIKVPKQKNNFARGLMQITDSTLKIMNDEKGELIDHFIKLTKDEVMDPSANIYASIRWLFYKKKWASNKLKREATWKESVAAYKSYLDDLIKEPNVIPTGMKNIYRNYDMLKKCKN